MAAADSASQALPLVSLHKENEVENKVLEERSAYNKKVLIPLKHYDRYLEMKAKDIPNAYERKIRELQEEAVSAPDYSHRIEILNPIASYRKLLNKINDEAPLETEDSKKLKKDLLSANAVKVRIGLIKNEIKQVSASKASAEEKNAKINSLMSQIRRLTELENNKNEVHLKEILNGEEVNGVNIHSFGNLKPGTIEAIKFLRKNKSIRFDKK